MYANVINNWSKRQFTLIFLSFYYFSISMHQALLQDYRGKYEAIIRKTNVFLRYFLERVSQSITSERRKARNELLLGFAFRYFKVIM